MRKDSGCTTVTRRLRDPKRPFTSDVAEIARFALQVWAQEQFLDPKDLSGSLVVLWRNAVQNWYKQDPEFRTAKVWNKMLGCPSSVFWTPRLVESRLGPAAARFCCQSWICPFCYSREIVQFLRPLEDLRFELESNRENSWDPVPAWQASQARSATLSREHGGCMSWRYAVRSDDHAHPGLWTIWSVWIYPGDWTLAQQREYLATAFAYPYGLLDAGFNHVRPGLEFMQTHRGREVTGIYRKLKKEQES
jgi:hypothetical protein